ncbi:hypothetical protein [Pseudofrankia asymbiotica]|uniref:Uncharacterized protein n=1 Tax=Pseudofrankia asymbiotica TaxID=1834516 RepID=A0A1V2I8S6_9ACTN|nr:hypothetical protein [Pseudofrankia asymbiotica]ONH28817.1 hypothetical protein BL253_18435 [Pseudofrankia asymbiotica]
MPTLDGRPVEPGSMIEFVTAYVFGSGTAAGKIMPGSRFTIEGVDDTDYSDPMWGDARDEDEGPARLLIRVVADGVSRMIGVPCDPAIIRAVTVRSRAQA